MTQRRSDKLYQSVDVKPGYHLSILNKSISPHKQNITFGNMANGSKLNKALVEYQNQEFMQQDNNNHKNNKKQIDKMKQQLILNEGVRATNINNFSQSLNERVFKLKNEDPLRRNLIVYSSESVAKIGQQINQHPQNNKIRGSHTEEKKVGNLQMQNEKRENQINKKINGLLEVNSNNNNKEQIQQQISWEALCKKKNLELKLERLVPQNIAIEIKPINTVHTISYQYNKDTSSIQATNKHNRYFSTITENNRYGDVESPHKSELPKKKAHHYQLPALNKNNTQKSVLQDIITRKNRWKTTVDQIQSKFELDKNLSHQITQNNNSIKKEQLIKQSTSSSSHCNNQEQNMMNILQKSGLENDDTDDCRSNASTVIITQRKKNNENKNVASELKERYSEYSFHKLKEKEQEEGEYINYQNTTTEGPKQEDQESQNFKSLQTEHYQNNRSSASSTKKTKIICIKNLKRNTRSAPHYVDLDFKQSSDLLLQVVGCVSKFQEAHNKIQLSFSSKEKKLSIHSMPPPSPSYYKNPLYLSQTSVSSFQVTPISNSYSSQLRINSKLQINNENRNSYNSLVDKKRQKEQKLFQTAGNILYRLIKRKNNFSFFSKLSKLFKMKQINKL